MHSVRRLRAETRRAHILEHARKLFSRHGYSGTSIGMIASAAGISQGLLYNYFSGKDALLSAMIDEVVVDAESIFAVDAAGSPGERLERLVRAAFDLVARHRDFWRLWYGLRMQPAGLASLGAPLSSLTATVRRTLASYAADAGFPRPDLEAELLFALIDGTSQHYVLEPNRYPLEEMTTYIIARWR
ncbi:MAG TPA: TetR/AcrR family transcriptional regulator [Gemmatimonadaceae bacterium]|nr:TetR/AcrR family transcriptional regulator [Gemmatimonadaceae bacterium]